MRRGLRTRRAARLRLGVALAVVGLVLMGGVAAAWGQDTPAAVDEDSLRAALVAKDPRLAAMAERGTLPTGLEAEALFREFDNKPKAGVRATVQSYLYYGELETNLAMRAGSQIRNKIAYSWNDYRSYDKVIESRSNRVSYGVGGLLPMTLDVTGNWDWSEDRSVNTQGILNLIKRNNLNGDVKMRKQGMRTGAFVHDLGASFGIVDESTENRGEAADRTEGNTHLRLQTGWEIDQGLVLAGRAFGQGSQGDRQLRNRIDTAKAIGDSLGAGAYYNKGWLVGKAVITQSSFDSEYLDWRRNDRGSPDTSGIAIPEAQIVRERRTTKKQAIVLENEVRFGRVGIQLDVARTVGEVAYAKSRQGVLEDFQEKVDVQATVAVGRDSFAANYNYKWVWDDQVLREGNRRGRQNKRLVGAGLKWYRPLFRSTRLTVVFDQTLDQQIPDDRPNGQNKDLLRTAASASLRRAWGKSDVALDFRWTQSQNLAIDAASSIENNTRDRYEIAPEFTWQLRDWVRFSQEYTLYIEYRDYDYPDDRSRQNSYDKRGNLTSFLTFTPTSRLRISLKHQYNRFFKAKRSGDAVGGGSVYATNSEQTISQIDFGLSFQPVNGVFLETSTYRGRDHKLNPQTGIEGATYKGQITTGVRTRRRWGTTNPLELQARVEKVNAFGPGIRPASASYWKIDSWLQWSF